MIILVFLFLIALAADIALDVRPMWFAPLRNFAPAPGVGIGARSGHVAARLRIVSANPSGTTIDVPARVYSITVTFEHPMWLEIKSPPSADGSVIAATLSPTSSPISETIHGTASLLIGAQALSITIGQDGATVIGTIGKPRVGYTYTFVATGRAQSH